MSAFIKLNKQDAFVTSYVAHKSWSISSASLQEYGIDILEASVGTTGSVFNPGFDPTTGINGDQYQELVYNSLKHLYYSGVYTGNPLSSSYEEYLQTTLYPSSSRTLVSDALVVTIPQAIFGNAIRPGTFAMGGDIPIQSYVSGAYINTGYFTISSGLNYNVYDNGEGVLLESGSTNKVGDIIYTHGLAIITDSAYIAQTNTALSSSEFGVYWQSTKDIYTHNYRCKVRESDLNFTQNPSIKSGSNGDVYDFATGSYFQPYVTTVGLYNDSNELVGIGKLGQPVPKSKYTDMTFVVKFDI